MIYGTGIFTYIYPQGHLNVSINTSPMDSMRYMVGFVLSGSMESMDGKNE